MNETEHMSETDYNDAIRAHKLSEGFDELFHQLQYEEMVMQDYPEELTEAGRQEMEDFHTSVVFIFERMRELYPTFDRVREKMERPPVGVNIPADVYESPF